MKKICLYFQLHQPIRLKRYRFIQIGQDHYYYDDFQNGDRIRQVAEQSYLPANEAISDMIRTSGGKFKCTFSLSGIVLEQLEQNAPEVIDSFKALAKTGAVDFLAEPYAHSMASVFDASEFEMQVKMHTSKIESLFGIKPTVFRNSELIYSDDIGTQVAQMGYKVMLIDEAKHIMGWKSPNFIYSHAWLPKLKLLVRNSKLSTDIAHNFSNRSWADYPLTAEKFVYWINQLPQEEKIVNLWMGYESLGISNKADTGIFEFLKALPYHSLANNIEFTFAGEAAKKSDASGNLSVPYPISWYGHEKDLSPWNGNDLQHEALNKLYSVGERVRLCQDKPLLRDWQILQTLENFRYMSHKHNFESNFESAYDAFMNYMNILSDFLERVDQQYPTTIENEELNELLKTINEQDKEIETLQAEVKKLRARREKIH